jgi:hypothetical protein
MENLDVNSDPVSSAKWKTHMIGRDSFYFYSKTVPHFFARIIMFVFRGVIFEKINRGK